MRQELYLRTLAAAFLAAPAADRLAGWRSLEHEFRTAFRREHPTATEDEINGAFLDLAKAISARMAMPERRPILTLRAR